MFLHRKHHKQRDWTTRFRAVCRNFTRGGGGGGANLRYLKKEGEAAANSVRESIGRQCGPPQHIKQNLKHLAK